MDTQPKLFRRHLWFLFFAGASFLVFWLPLLQLVHLGLARDYESHIFLVLPVSTWLIYRSRNEIFAHIHNDAIPNRRVLLLAAILGLAAALNDFVNADVQYLGLQILALIVLWISGFATCYGGAALHTTKLAFFFLFLLIPIPDFVVGRTISYLQIGSAYIAMLLFKGLHLPVFREGLVLHIPALDLEVTKECSGLRSSVILFMTTLLMGEFALHSAWRKSLLVLSVIPIVILKNGLRIVTISLLTVYLNRGFLHGWLHQSGGMVFYLLGLLALLPVLKLLRRGESPRPVCAGRTDLISTLASGLAR